MEKFSDLMGKTEDDLFSALIALKKDIFAAKIASARSVKMRLMRRQVARIHTALSMKKLGAG